MEIIVKFSEKDIVKYAETIDSIKRIANSIEDNNGPVVAIGEGYPLQKINVNVDRALSAIPQATQVPQTPPVPQAPIQVPPAQAEAVQSAPVQTSIPSLSLEQLSLAGATLMDAGKTEDLIQALKTFGVSTLQELNPTAYPAFALELRRLGAQI